MAVTETCFHSLPTQVVPWARKNKREQPAGTACKECFTISHAYPNMTFTALAGKYCVSGDFRAEIEGCRKVLRGKGLRWYPQNVWEDQDLNIAMLKDYKWLPEVKFAKMYPNLAPADVGVEVSEMVNELGVVERGFVLDDDTPLKTLRVSCRTGVRMETRFMDGARQLHANQGKDTLMFAQKASEVGGAVKSGVAFQAPTFSELNARARARLAAPAPPPPEPVSQTQAEAAPQQVSDGDEMDSENECDPAELLAGTRSQNPKDGPKGKGKGPGKGKGKKRAHTQCHTDPTPPNRASASSAAAVGSGPEGPALRHDVEQATRRRRLSDGADTRTVRSRSPRSVVSLNKVSTAHLLQQQNKYLKTLNQEGLHSLLLGAKMGNDINNSVRVIEALEQRSAETSESVELQASVHLAQHAKKLTVDTMHLLDRTERKERLQALCSHMSSFPLKWSTSLVLMAVKDLVSDLCSACEAAARDVLNNLATQWLAVLSGESFVEGSSRGSPEVLYVAMKRES